MISIHLQAFVWTDRLLWKIGETTRREIALQIKRSLHDPELIIGPGPFHLIRDALYLREFIRINHRTRERCSRYFWLSAKRETSYARKPRKFLVHRTKQAFLSRQF